jgi:enoyl-CoA hydratase
MTLLTYAVVERVATITMDDGKANALSPAMQDEIGQALDRAEADGVTAIVLAGRDGRFSGGFDLRVLNAGGSDAERMLRGGFTLAERLLQLPVPVVAACTGHAIAMGSFLLLAADHRIGAAGPFTIQANEVRIGLTMPYAALALLRSRLTPAAFDRAAVLGEPFDPEAAVVAGFLDRVVDPADVVTTAQATAASFSALDPVAHLGTKQRARAAVLAELADAIDREFAVTNPA